MKNGVRNTDDNLTNDLFDALLHLDVVIHSKEISRSDEASIISARYKLLLALNKITGFSEGMIYSKAGIEVHGNEIAKRIVKPKKTTVKPLARKGIP